MEHLTKQQMVLLTLLVSFVTSIATGIVTVSLINQAPANTTNTVERVIENTVAAALPSGNVAAVEESDVSGDSLTIATNNAQKSIVKIGEYDVSGSFSGLGVVINSRGTVVTDKSNVSGLKNIGVTYADGQSYAAAVIESQTNGDLVFLDPLIPSSQILLNADSTSTDSSASSTISSTSSLTASAPSFVPASIADFPKLGEMVASLGGTLADTLGIGVVDQIVTSGPSSTPFAVSTTIASGKVIVGSPLFDISGGLIGLYTSSLSTASSTQFYLLAPVKTAFPK